MAASEGVGSQFLDHWPKPLAIRFGRSNPLSVDGSPHLLAARRCHCGCRFVEIDARRLVVEMEELQDAPGLAFDIFDQVLVPELEDCAWRCGID